MPALHFSLLQNCQLISMANPVSPGVKGINGAVTAHGRASKDDNTGFVFFKCTVGGNGRVWLGRAWRPFSRVVFAFTTMTDIIAPEGWNDFNDITRDLYVHTRTYIYINYGFYWKNQSFYFWVVLIAKKYCRTLFYGEYNCSGSGANMSMRASYVQRLNDTQASPFLNVSFIEADQWLQPYSTS